MLVLHQDCQQNLLSIHQENANARRITLMNVALVESAKQNGTNFIKILKNIVLYLQLILLNETN
jgi:hypothetical protein